MYMYSIHQYLTMLQAYEKQLKECNSQIKKLEEEKELLKMDMNARWGGM